jgi:hypothetical protein
LLLGRRGRAASPGAGILSHCISGPNQAVERFVSANVHLLLLWPAFGSHASHVLCFARRLASLATRGNPLLITIIAMCCRSTSMVVLSVSCCRLNAIAKGIWRKVPDAGSFFGLASGVDIGGLVILESLRPVLASLRAMGKEQHVPCSSIDYVECCSASQCRPTPAASWC